MKLKNFLLITSLFTLASCVSTPKTLELDYVYDYSLVDFSSLYEVPKELTKITKPSKDYSLDVKSQACNQAFREKTVTTKATFNTCLKAAKNGDPELEFKVSEMYFYGDGVKKNLQESYKWCLKAARSSNIIAMSKLGEKYLKGQGTKVNNEKAIFWLKKAAKERSLESIMALGKLTYKGEWGVTKSAGEAFKWYLYAATEGLPSAQVEVAKMLFNGIGVKEDKREALSWLQVSLSCEPDNEKSKKLKEQFLLKITANDIALSKIAAKELTNRFGCSKSLQFEIY